MPQPLGLRGLPGPVLIGIGVLVFLICTAGNPFPPRAEEQPVSSSSIVIRQRVRILSQQLAAEELRTRQQAERELLDLGTQTLKWLPDPAFIRDPAASQAIRRIREQLERRSARESLLPSRITLEGKRPLSDVLLKIEEQTGNRIGSGTLSPEQKAASVELHWRGIEFWAAASELAHKSDLSLDVQPDVIALVKSTPGNRELAVHLNGPFRLAVRNVSRVDIVGDDKGQLLRLHTELSAEPRLRGLFWKYFSRDWTLKSAEKLNLEPFSPEAQYDLPMGEGGHAVPFELSFRITKDISANRLFPVDLQGKGILQTAAGHENFRFEQLESRPNVVRHRGGVTVTHEKTEVHQRGPHKETSVSILVKYDVGGPAFESHRTWIFHNTAYLEDSTGKMFQPVAFDTNLQVERVVRVTYHFRDLSTPLEAHSFVYVAPTLLVDVPLDFSLKLREVE